MVVVWYIGGLAGGETDREFDGGGRDVAYTAGRKPFKNFATPGWRIYLQSYVRQY